VVVDSDLAHVNEALSQGYLAIHDDATEEAALRRAGIDRAKTLVVTLPSDADNVFITLTARDLNPRVQIIARAELRSTEKKLFQAGANRVVLPATTGGLRMAAMVTRPSMVELVDLASGGSLAEMAIDELPIPAASPIVGNTIGDSHARSRYGLLIVAIRGDDGQLALNPGAATRFRAGDAVIALGRVEDIERFRAEYKL
jgi:voltage-gated potassium channel